MGCKGDDVTGTRSKLSTAATRASRVPSKVVGDPITAEDADVSGVSDNHLLRRLGLDAGSIPVEPLRDRERLEVDTLAAREPSGVSLDVELRQSDLPAPAGPPETAAEGLEDLRNKTRLRMRIDVAAAGRMRITFLGQGFPWPEGTELRARADRFGHVLVWPDGKNYRNVVPGALRGLFADRRLDIGPLFSPKLSSLPPAQFAGLSTSRTLLSTPIAEIQIDQATVPSAGLGAALLCRTLIELAGAEPDSKICNGELLPLHAQLTNAPGGKLGFFVTAIGKKQEYLQSALVVPPEHASFQTSGLPLVQGGTVTRSLLSALRHRSAVPGNPPSLQAPATGLLAVNRALSLRALLIDGVSVAWVAPGTELLLPELRNGLYSVAWRDFFGSSIEPPRNVTLPARVTVGAAPDAAN